jgi:hypothetical protein
MNSWLKWFFTAFAWALIQVYLVDQLNIAWWIKPLPYLYFIFILPFDINKFGLLVIAYFFGLSIDILSGSIGIHTASTLTTVFIKYFIDHRFFNLDSIQLQGHYTINEHAIGRMSFIGYILSILFIHHFLFFLLDYFDLTQLPLVLLLSVTSSIVTLFIVFLATKLTRVH